MGRLATWIVPPVFVAQLSGVYHIEQTARVVKAYRYDETVMYRVLRRQLPKDWDTMGYMDQVAAIRAVAERQNV
jgi:hypothetical protein